MDPTVYDKLFGVRDHNDDEANDFLEFYKTELSLGQSQEHQKLIAAGRVNEIAVAIGMDKSRKELVPFLDEVLRQSRGNLAVVLTLARALSAPKEKTLIKQVPLDCLRWIICKHLLVHDEVDIRKIGIGLMEEALEIVIHPGADFDLISDHLTDIFEPAYPELLDLSLLAKNSYLRTVAGLIFLARAQALAAQKFGDDKVRIILKAEEVHSAAEAIIHVGAHVSSFAHVRITLAREFSTLRLSPDVGSALLMDPRDQVIVEACSSDCLGAVLSDIVQNKGGEEFTSLVTRLAQHDDYRVRVAFVRGAQRWLSRLATEKEDEVIASLGQVLEAQLMTDTEIVAQRMLIECLSSSPVLFNVVQSSVLEDVMKVLEEKPTVDTETRLCISRAQLNLFKHSRTSTDCLITRLEHETDPMVHLFLVDSLYDVSFIRRYGGPNMLKEVLRTLSLDVRKPVPHSKSVSNDVTCWRSLVLVLERSERMISAFDNANDKTVWAARCGGTKFLEFCLAHPCAKVGQVCVQTAIARLIPILGNDWVALDLLPMLARLVSTVKTATMKGNMLLAAELLVDSKSAWPAIGEILMKTIHDRSPAIRSKSAALCRLLFEKMAQNGREEALDALRRTLITYLESKDDNIAKNELQKALEACQPVHTH